MKVVFCEIDFLTLDFYKEKSPRIDILKIFLTNKWESCATASFQSLLSVHLAWLLFLVLCLINWTLKFKMQSKLLESDWNFLVTMKVQDCKLQCFQKPYERWFERCWSKYIKLKVITESNNSYLNSLHRMFLPFAMNVTNERNVCQQ